MSGRSSSYTPWRRLPSPYPTAAAGEKSLECGHVDTEQMRARATVYPDGSMICAYCRHATGRRDRVIGGVR